MRKDVRVFVSYASKDARLVSDLLDRLESNFAASRAHAYETWEFRKLVASVRWHEEIQRAIAVCHLGMLCLSPAFLASKYIREFELKPLLRDKRIIPVGIKPVDFRLHDAQGLDAYQLFRLRTPRGDLRCYEELDGNAQRDAFALELFRAIETRLAEERD